MRKKELVHTHTLLREVTHYLIENENMPAKTTATYDALEVRPSSIHKSKRNHREAITVLGDSIERWLEQAPATNVDRPVN
jgi:hypothetical protein